jgi:hypothetical protein
MPTYKLLLIAATGTLVILTGRLLNSMQPVISCDPAPPNIYVSCGDLYQPIVPNSLTVYEQLAAQLESEPTREATQVRQVQLAIESLRAAAPACQMDVAPALPALEEEIRAWVADESNSLNFVSGQITFTRYSIEHDREAQRAGGNLLTCSYQETKHVGDWMVVSNALRSYCRPAHRNSCYEWTVSPAAFLFYLVAHPSLATLPWLAGLLLAAGACLYGCLLLVKDKPENPGALLAPLACAELYFLLEQMVLWSQIFGWIIFCYSLVLLYRRRKRDL